MLAVLLAAREYRGNKILGLKTVPIPNPRRQGKLDVCFGRLFPSPVYLEYFLF
jgi:hypothetical protein